MKKDKLTQDQLFAILEYNKDSGIFTRRVYTSSNAKAGSVAGCTATIGYRVISVLGTAYYAHRLAWLYVYGKFPDGQIDHIDGNRKNNSIDNLRDVPESINRQNLRSAPKNSSLQILGVSRSTSGKRFSAKIQVDKKIIHLGIYDTAEEAKEAYLAAKRKMHPGCTI